LLFSAEIYTDGSCHTQKCIGAWAAIILIENEKIVLSGNEFDTTHNRMEILAVIKAIQHIKQHFIAIAQLTVVSDSQYVVGLIERKLKFVASDFKTKAGNDIRNIDLVKELLNLILSIQVTFVKIKAHQKKTNQVNYNIDVDFLSRSIVRELAK
jgi:ribonuclease HI